MFILAFDNQDEKLGAYFSECADEIKDVISSELLKTLIEISGEQLNIVNIDTQLSLINNAGFIFCTYSHGTITSLNSKKVAYIKSEVNTQNLKNSLTYTNACLAGNKLGSEIIAKGGRTFIGYKDEVHSILDEQYKKISIRCDNYALILFLNNYSVKEALTKTRAYFNEKIDSIGFQSPFIAAILRENRDSLVAYGDLDLTMEELLKK